MDERWYSPYLGNGFIPISKLMLIKLQISLCFRHVTSSHSDGSILLINVFEKQFFMKSSDTKIVNVQNDVCSLCSFTNDIHSPLKSGADTGFASPCRLK